MIKINLKKNLCFTLVAVSIFFMTGNSFAFMNVDGNLSDVAEWGVTPGAWGASSDWTPNAGITSTVDDYRPGTNGGYVGPGWGGQTFDVEAMYLKNDVNNFYFAIVTGFPIGGSQGYIAGDIGLDFDKDGSYEYGICVKDRNGTYKAGNVYKVTSNSSWVKGLWTSIDPMSDYAYLKNFSTEQGFGGTNLAYNNTYYSATDHWVIEGYVPVSAFGDEWTHGRDVRVHWAMSCTNDYLNLDYVTTPEPATLSLLGLGLFGLARFRKKVVGGR